MKEKKERKERTKMKEKSISKRRNFTILTEAFEIILDILDSNGP